jgi:alpha-ketoglutarate-dependent taurine dioxygenase
MKTLPHFRTCTSRYLLDVLKSDGALLVKGLSVDNNADFLEFAEKLGPTLTQNGPFEVNQIEDSVVYRVEQSRTGRALLISETDGAFDYHTDGFRARVPPSIVLLLCISPATHGGELFLVSVADAISDLSSDDLSELLTHQYSFPSCSSRTVLTRKENGAVEVSYNLYDIVNCDLNKRCSIAPEVSTQVCAPVIQRFHRAINDCPSRVQVTLNSGDCIAIDNTSVLHARSSFRGPRLVKRVWIGLTRSSDGFGHRC